MQLGFSTESLEHAKCALLLYAMYRSREKNSSLNGMETWDRCRNFIRGAVLKSETVGGFVNEFCKKAGVLSIKPIYLGSGGLVKIDEGTLIEAEGVYDYHIQIFADKELLKLFEKESQYIIMLVREKIQREKEIFKNATED